MCHCPVTHDGAEEESYSSLPSSACLDSKEVYEPALRMRLESAHSDYYSTPYSDKKEEYLTSEYDGDGTVVPANTCSMKSQKTRKIFLREWPCQEISATISTKNLGY